jgi:hypothetical protein
VSKDYTNEIGYEALLFDFKRYQKQTPRGVGMAKKGQNIYLQFKTPNTARKQYSCGCSFTLDGMVDALKKTNKVAEALKSLASETEFWQWYDKEIKHTYFPQVQLHFREERYDAADNNRIPIRSVITFRWVSDNYSTGEVTALKNKIKADFVNPPFSFGRGRECWTYWDDRKGYRFTVYVQNEVEAKKIISQVIGIQDTGTPDWENKLRQHKDNVDYATPGMVRVMDKTQRKPRKRPIGTVKFAYAELFVPGVTKPIVLIDRTGSKVGALEYA